MLISFLFIIKIVTTFVTTMKKAKIIRFRVEENLFYKFKKKVSKSKKYVSEVMREFMYKYVTKK